MNMFDDKETKFGKFLSERTSRVKSSFIRDILAVAKQPGVISFAGGLPHPDTFPEEELTEIFGEVIRDKDALQYGTTGGYLPLREELVEYMAKLGVTSVSPDNVLITTGSQQSLFELPFILLDHGDRMVIEEPTFIGALGPIRMFGYEHSGSHNIESIKMDEHGMRLDILEELLDQCKRENRKMPKYVYTIPTFQNPTGITMTNKRRKQLYDLACENDFLIVEDDPYGEIRYDGEKPKLIKSLDEPDQQRVIFLGTFSKIFAPVRVGWTVGHEEIIHELSKLKQNIDLNTQALSQRILTAYMKKGMLDEHIKEIIPFYKEKRDTMLASMDKHFDKNYTQWVKPEGGLFTWVKANGVDTYLMARRAVEEHKVAYVPGAAFYLDMNHGRDGMRVNFSYTTNEEIKIGIEKLAQALEEDHNKQEEGPAEI